MVPGEIHTHCLFQTLKLLKNTVSWCDGVQYSRCSPTFWRTILPPFQGERAFAHQEEL
jgi:hypothetical protein